MGYQYRGKPGRTRAEILEDAEERWQEKAHEQYQADPPAAVRDLKPCGTTAAYNRHRARNEEPCADCTEANRKRVAELRKQPRPRKAAQHGTPSGAVAHYRNKTALCEPCKQARSEYRNGFKKNAAQDAYDRAMEQYPDNVWLGPHRLETLNMEVARAVRTRKNHQEAA